MNGTCVLTTAVSRGFHDKGFLIKPGHRTLQSALDITSPLLTELTAPATETSLLRGPGVLVPQNPLCWIPTPQCDGAWRRGLRSEGRSCSRGTPESSLTLPPREGQREETICEWETRNWPCQCLNLGLPGPQDFEKEISVVYELPSPQCFVNAVKKDWSNYTH